MRALTHSRRYRESTAAQVRKALAAAAIGAAMSGVPAPAQPTPAHSERLSVREVEVVFEAPMLPPGRKSVRDLRADDLQVIEDGIRRPVVRVEPIGPDHAWTLRLYFDLALARPETVFRAAIALAAQAQQLTRLGTVEIVVADPQPETVLAASQEPARVEEVLADLASRAANRRSGAAARTLESRQLEQQCDRLVTSLTAKPLVGPHALFWVVDPVLLESADLARLGSATGSRHDESTQPAPQPGDKVATLATTARLLSAYGWVTVSLPMRRLSGAAEPAPEEELARIERAQQDPQQPAGANLTPAITAFIHQLLGKRTPPNDLRLVAPQLDPENAAWAAFVRPTAGMLAPYRDSLAVALDGLGQRCHLWYQADAAPADRERSLVIKVPGRPQEVRAQVWVRSTIPVSLAEARARRLLAGETGLGGQVELKATGGAERALVARIAAGDADGGPLRVVIARRSGGEIKFETRTLSEADLARWDQRHEVALTVPPPAAGEEVAVVFEDLANERWGGTLLAAGR